jgi:glycosyltransferase involved in cell wall biosynthesis
MNGKVSLIIPTIEEERIFDLIRKVRSALGKNIEIIIVDKSSNAYYNRLKKTGAKVLRQTDKGVENAIMFGLRNAKGNILASIDADGTHDIEGLVKGIKMIKNNDADLVLGNRLSNLEKGSMTLYLKLGNSILSWLYARLYKNKIHDVLTGLFVMNRRAFDRIHNIEPYRAGIAFFAIELAKRNFRIKEVNIKYYRRREGQSKLAKSKFAYGFGVASHLIRQIRDYSPLLIFGTIGVVLIIIGAVLGVMVIISFLNSGLLNEIGRALISFMLIVLGMLSIMTGFILDLLLEILKRIDEIGH